MNQYEVTFIVDPVLSGDEIKATAQTYVDQLTSAGCAIVHVDEMGLRPLAFAINKRSSGIYYCVEFTNVNGTFMDNLELSLRRDERIMRFLTVKLDKYGAKYNEDKRNGLIGKRKKKSSEPSREDAPAPRPSREAAPAPAPAPAPVAKAVVVEEMPAPPPVVEVEVDTEPILDEPIVDIDAVEDEPAKD
ncbi:MAG: 30S ribosomal protein S6 [Saprospirales bacterium]|nr:30S ribosomal protein S6 [Saprospirales bacterium]MBK6902552.1 30S ribosomal protein S6 [Saprospirales bacterium]